MRKLLFIIGVLLFAQPLSAQIFLRENTSIDIRMGPFLSIADGITPVTGATIAAADEAEVLKANGAVTSTMAGTLAAVTGADGWYDYTVQTGDVDTIGEILFVMQDDSAYLPVFVRAYVLESPVYDALFATGAPGYLQPTVASRTLDVTIGGTAGIDLDNTEGTLDAAEIGADAITAAKVAADVTTEITAGLLKPISVGTAQAGGTSTQIILASTEDFSADDRINCAGVHIYSGTGKGQFKIITAYTNATDTATVDSAWAANPDATSVYQLLQLPCTITAAEFAGLVWDAAIASYVDAGSTGEKLNDIPTSTFSALATGTAQAGAATTIQLAAASTFADDELNGNLACITASTGAGQCRIITDYVGSTDTATVDTWTTNPTSSSVYAIIGFPTLQTAASLADAVLDEALSGHTTGGTVGAKLNDSQTYKVRPRNVAVTDNPLVPFAANGTVTKNATAIACEISKDGGAFVALNTPNLTEVEATQGAIWTFDLIQAETDAEFATVICSGTGMLTTAINFEFREVTP